MDKYWIEPIWNSDKGWYGARVSLSNGSVFTVGEGCTDSHGLTYAPFHKLGIVDEMFDFTDIYEEDPRDVYPYDEPIDLEMLDEDFRKNKLEPVINEARQHVENKDPFWE